MWRAAVLTCFVALAAGLLSGPARAEGPAVVPSFRLDRTVSVAGAYRTLSVGTIACPELDTAPAIDGNLEDWPAAQEGQTLSLGDGSAALTTSSEGLSARLRVGWDAAALYVGAVINDDVLLPAAEDDPRSGDSLEISFSGSTTPEEEDPPTFLIAAASTGPILRNVEGSDLTEVADGKLAISDSPGRRTVELRLPWAALRPIRQAQGKQAQSRPSSSGESHPEQSRGAALRPFVPYGQEQIRLGLRLEDRDSAQELEPAYLDNRGHEALLVLLPGSSHSLRAYLNLPADSLAPGEPLQGTLLVDSTQPALPLHLGLEIVQEEEQVMPAADRPDAPPAPSPGPNEPQAKTRVFTNLRLDEGVNTFHLYWDPSAPLQGNYLVRASGDGPEGQLFALQASFNVAQTPSAWETLGRYSEKLSIPVVLKKVQQAAANKPLKFAVLGDSRDGEAIFAQLLQQAAQEGAEFAIVLGDLVSAGRSDQYLRFAKILENAPLPVLVLPGNHDYVGQGKARYQRLFGPLNYSFDLAGYHFIALDNANGRLSSAQLDWLETQLQSKGPKFVFLHEPPKTIPRWAWHSFSDGAERFTALMEKYRPSRVFLAHIHGYDRVTQNGVEYVLSGGAGAPLYPQLGPQAAIYHLVLVEAGPKGVSDTLVKMAWQKEPAKAAAQ